MQIYGENFNRYKKDYYAARDRQDILRRARDVKAAIDPFIAWLQLVSRSETFDQYETVQKQIAQRMPWLWEQLKWHTNNAGGKLQEIKLPPTLFDGFTDPHHEFKTAAAEFGNLGLLLVGKIEIDKDITVTFGRMQTLLSRIERTLNLLQEVIDFFQPAILAPLCAWATANHHPIRRKYHAELACITCLNDGNPTTICAPKSYKISSREPLVTLRSALAGLGLQ
jgi:hypothetical protein